MATSSPATPSKLEAQLTGKAKQLEEEHMKGMSEAERLREEVNRSRALRANRAANRSQKSISSMSGFVSPSSPLTSPPLGAHSSSSSGTTTTPIHSHTDSSTAPIHHVQPNQTVKLHSSSFPVFTGRVGPPSNAGTSLANFIGGDTKIKGPILNKVRPYEEESLLSEEERVTPQATFLARNPALLPRNAGAGGIQSGNGRQSPGVALPGMTRPTPSASSSSSTFASVPTAAHAGSNTTKATSTSLSGNRGESTFGKPITEKSATDPMPRIGLKSPLLNQPSNIAVPAYDRTISKSPAPMEKLTLEDKKETPSQPFQGFNNPSPALSLQADRDDNKPPTAMKEGDDTISLGRLRGASIVKQRLQWAGGEAKKNNETSSSPIIGSSTSRFTVPTHSPKSVSSNYGAFKSSSLDSSMDESSSKEAEERKEENRTPIQTKRSSVLDRWNRDTPNQNPTSASASPQASPKPDSQRQQQQQGQTSKWPKPAYSSSPRPILGSKTSWSAAAGSTSPGLGGDSDDRHRAASFAAEEPKDTTNRDSTVDEKKGDVMPEVKIAEEPKSTFQRPVTKPPWMTQQQQTTQPSKESISSSLKSTSVDSATPPIRAASFPRPQIQTSNLSGLSSSRSPVPSPKPSRSMPSPSLPISVSPAPYARSPTIGGNSASAAASSPRASSFQPSATSYPVSLGVAPTHSRPLSLARFIGGDKHINGPVLSKVRPEELDGYGLENDATSSSSASNAKVGTFLTHNPGVLNEMMMKKNRVAMPGMVPSGHTNNTKSSSPVPSPSTASKPWSATPTAPASHTMEKKVSNSGNLPLPGMESPKLPLPGEDPSSPPSVLGGTTEKLYGDEGHNEGIEQTNSNTTSGYRTMHHSDPIQPSESTTLSAMEASSFSRPSATRTLSHQLEKSHHDEISTDTSTSVAIPRDENEQASPNEDNPWAAIGSAMLSSGEETIKAPIKPKTHRAMPSWEGTLKTLGKGPARHAPKPPSGQSSPTITKPRSDPVIVRRPAIRMQDLPPVKSFRGPTPSVPQITFEQYVSVDVLSITDDAKAETVPPKEQHIFYSTELLAIVLRSKKGGLISTEIVIWRGKHCSEDGREKVSELENRYRASVMHVGQGKENLQLVKALGGRLITRQGFRGGFDVLNSSLYRVQTKGKGISFIDEVELQASSLCSAYSYIASVFQDLFVWYGRGTPDEESRVAVQYAEELAKAGPGAKKKVAHMLEGAESDLWRDIMGHEEEYAFANHWRFRLDNPVIAQTPTLFYQVDSSFSGSSIQLIGDETSCSLSDGATYIVRTPLEYFVVVTPSARGNGKEIATSLRAVSSMTQSHTMQAVPFRPTQHVLVLPSLVPRDLQASLRSSVLDDLNSPYQPTTMNVVDESIAWEHLGRDAFYKSEIVDLNLLPVGVSPEILQ